MIELKTVLLPTDFSDFSAEATKYACAFADQFGAELHLLHVLDLVEAIAPEFGMGLALPSRTAVSNKAVENALSDVLDDAWADSHQVVQAVVNGPPFLEIIKYARKHNIDLIVMGTHGRSGLVHVLMGSVAEKVVRKAPCPVLTVRPEGHQFVMP